MKRSAIGAVVAMVVVGGLLVYVPRVSAATSSDASRYQSLFQRFKQAIQYKKTSTSNNRRGTSRVTPRVTPRVTLRTTPRPTTAEDVERNAVRTMNAGFSQRLTEYEAFMEKVHLRRDAYADEGRNMTETDTAIAGVNAAFTQLRTSVQTHATSLLSDLSVQNTSQRRQQIRTHRSELLDEFAGVHRLMVEAVNHMKSAVRDTPEPTIQVPTAEPTTEMTGGYQLQVRRVEATPILERYNIMLRQPTIEVPPPVN